MMDINNPNERQVVCVSNDSLGAYSFGEDASVLTVGKYYTVYYVEVHSWHTLVELKEFPGKQFNSVHFDELNETDI